METLINDTNHDSHDHIPTTYINHQSNILTDIIVKSPSNILTKIEKKNSNNTNNKQIFENVCCSCNQIIESKDILILSNKTRWHQNCLKCSVCNQIIVEDSDQSTNSSSKKSKTFNFSQKCFLDKNNEILCKTDYYKLYGVQCAKCNRGISSSDWVRKAENQIFHLACFSCHICKRQLSSGEEFAISRTKKGDLLCKSHYNILIYGEDKSAKESRNCKSKRVRTTFTDEQLQILQANFDLDSNPDGQDLERIAQLTGLSKRVTQVWFQNSRARQKKHKEKFQYHLETSPNSSGHTNNNNNTNCIFSSYSSNEFG
ncbi:hypothetical protein SNEBB_005474 [Seison nebaliae]|nr:hypothetical protein SNEBB_005474 [Seison nebaliae]